MRWRDAGDSGGGSVAGSSGSFERALRRVTDIVNGDTVEIENGTSYRISSDAMVPEREADRKLRLAASTSAIDSAELDGASTTIKLSDLLAKVIRNPTDMMNPSNSLTFQSVEGSTMYIGRLEGGEFRIGSVSPNFYHVYIRDDQIDIRPERLEDTVDARIQPFARAGATLTKIATYRFPTAERSEPYPAGATIDDSTWELESAADPQRYSLTDDGITLRISRVLPATLSGFYGEVKVGSKVSTFIVPWTLVVAPTSTSALTLDAHNVEQGYYMTIPDNNQNGYSVMLVVQRQAVIGYNDAIYFRGCGNNIPAGVTVDLYELLS